MAEQTQKVDGRAALKRELLRRKLQDLQAQAQGVPPVEESAYDKGKLALQSGGATTGASIGGILGSGLGPGGTLGGAMLGAGIGAIVGNETNYAINSYYGFTPQPTLADRLEEDAWAGGTAGAWELVGSGLGAGIRAGGKAILRGFKGPGTVRKNIANFAAGGAVPTYGEATEGLGIQFIESYLEKTPGPHGTMMRKLDETSNAFRNFNTQRAAELGGSSLDPEFAGSTARVGIENWRRQFTNKGSELEAEFTKYLNPATPSPAAAYKGELEKFTAVDPASPNVTGRLVPNTEKEMLNDIVKDLDLNAASGVDGLPVSALIRQRTRVGALLENFELVSDVSRGHAKDLYKALSADIRAAMGGNPEALAAFDRRNQHWQQGIQRIDNFLTGLYRKGIEPEKLFDAVYRSKTGTTMIRELYDTLDGEERQVVTGMILKRMGMSSGAEDAAWDSMKFHTEWQNIPNATKDIVFGPTNRSMFRRDLEQINQALEVQAQKYKKFGNPPRTAAGLIGPALVSAGLGSLIGYGLGVESTPGYAFTLGTMSLIGVVAARTLFANPRFVHWLAQSTRLSAGPTALTNHMAKLGGLAATSDPATREAILDYLHISRKVTTADFLKSQQPPEVPKGP